MARLYIFRPDFSELQKQDRPVLIVDDSYVVTVTRLSYSFVDLPMGHHSFRMAPGSTDSPIWALEGAFEVSAEGIFYLAVWNADTSLTTRPDYGAYAKDMAKSTAIGVATAALSGGLSILLMPRQPPRVINGGVSEARFELVPEEQALETLRQCELTPARLLPVAEGEHQ